MELERRQGWAMSWEAKRICCMKSFVALDIGSDTLEEEEESSSPSTRESGVDVWRGFHLHIQAGATLGGCKVAGEGPEAAAGAERRRRGALEDSDSQGGGGRGDAVWCGGLALRERRWGRGGGAEEEEEEETTGLMARGSGSGRWSRQRMGFLSTLLRCNLPPETQKVVVFLIMMLLIIINVVLMFLLAFQ
ncbi:hypothetical protein LDENG_00225000 [Lucifuga dentata]|nr:hypothetical protein LDENG_00225000 [Lucifuga dentata]